MLGLESSGLRLVDARHTSLEGLSLSWSRKGDCNGEQAGDFVRHGGCDPDVRDGWMVGWIEGVSPTSGKQELPNLQHR